MYHTETCSSVVGSPLPFMTRDRPNEVSPVPHLWECWCWADFFCERHADG